MANYYSESDYLRDNEQDTGGNLPLGLAGSTSDQLRGLPMTAQSGSTGVTAPGPLAVSDAPSDQDLADFASGANAAGRMGLGLTPSPTPPTPGLPIRTPDQGTGMPIRMPAMSPADSQLYAQLQAAYNQEMENSKSGLYRFLRGSLGQTNAPLQYLEAMSTLSQQAQKNQMAQESHQSQMLDAKIKQWESVSAYIQGLPENQQQAAIDYFAPKLVADTDGVTAGTPHEGSMTLDTAKTLLKTDGGVARWASSRLDADPADLAEAERIYRTEKDPAKRAELADAYLDKARQRKLAAVQPRVAGVIGPVIADMTRQNGGHAPTVEQAIEQVKTAIDQTDPGVIRSQYGVSPQFAKDAIDAFADSPAGKRFFDARGLATRANQMEKLGVSSELRPYIAQSPTFKVLAVNGKYTTTDSGLVQLNHDEPGLWNTIMAEAAQAKDAAIEHRMVTTGTETQKSIAAAKRGELLNDDPNRYVINKVTGQRRPLGSFTQDSLAEATKPGGDYVDLTAPQYEQHKASLKLDGDLLMIGQTIIPQLAVKPGQNFKTVAQATIKQMLGDQNVLTDLDSAGRTVIDSVRSAIGNSNRINQQELGIAQRGLVGAWDTQATATRKIMMLHDLNKLADDINMGRVTGADITKRWDAFAVQNGLRTGNNDFSWTRTK